MTSTTTHAPARRSARLLAYAHATVDFYQGAVAALVPFLVLERGYSYAAAAGIVLASSLSSSVVQPVFGALRDRWTMTWLIPVSILLAGVGIGAIAVSPSLWFTAVVAAISGVGVAGFHPAAAGRAREVCGDDHVLMSWFSLGGNLGFAVSPLAVGATVGVFGLRATPLLALPALTGVVAVAAVSHGQRTVPHGRRTPAHLSRPDDWRAFSRLSLAIVCRSIVFVGIGSFIVLFMRDYRGVSDAVAGLSLFVFYLGGAVGTAIGGHLARRWARTTILRSSYLLAIPSLAGLLLVPGALTLVFVAVTSIVLYVPFSLHVTLGQDYLPQHVGTASGVTLGLAVSIGGLAAPLIGALADRSGLDVALLTLLVLPPLAWLSLLGLTDPLTGTVERGREPAQMRS